MQIFGCWCLCCTLPPEHVRIDELHKLKSFNSDTRIGGANSRWLMFDRVDTLHFVNERTSNTYSEQKSIQQTSTTSTNWWGHSPYMYDSQNGNFAQVRNPTSHITLLRINTTNHAIFPLKPFMLHTSVDMLIFVQDFDNHRNCVEYFYVVSIWHSLHSMFTRNMNIFYFYRDINTEAFKHYLLFRIYSYKHQREIFIKYS